MLKSLKAFTLAEVMVTLAVLGILASLMLPIIGQVRPNKNKALFKKAYFVAERMVYEMVNDEDLYPAANTFVGFDNVSEVIYLGQDYGSKTNAAKKRSKFCEIFARKVNTTSDAPHCDGNHTTFSQSPAFETTDGVQWYMPNSNFSSSPQIIRVDVNGAKAPNCRQTSSNIAKCPNPDRFEIKVESDGKMYVDGLKEREYLQSNDSLR